MALDPMLSLAVLALLGLFLAVSVMRSVAKVTKRVLQVGLIIVILTGVGVLQLPEGIPGIADVAGVFQPSLTGFVTEATKPMNGTNVTASLNQSSSDLPVQQLVDLLESMLMDAADGS